MSNDLPDYFFRVRENGAAVFRIDTENRQRRIEMEQIAVVNVKRGDMKPQGNHTLTHADIDAISTWTEERQALLARREIDDIFRTIDHLNLTAQWVQSKATDAELEEITDQMLMAMHDLRSVLVRKKADRVAKAAKPE